MKTGNMLKEWILPQVNKQACVDMWNAMAPGFDQDDMPCYDSDSFMKLLTDYGMFNKSSAVLDIGCGTGRYSIALAKQCDKVIGVDLSPKMLEIANHRAKKLGILNTEFICLDWHELDLAEAGFAQAFDLVFARMTPAIQSTDTFMKLMLASRGWCAVSKPTKRNDSVSDALTDLIGIGNKHVSKDNVILYAFELIWLNGMLPRLEYEKQTWDICINLDEAYNIYINRLKTYKKLTPGEVDKAESYLKSIAVEGSIFEHTNMINTTIFWQKHYEV